MYLNDQKEDFSEAYVRAVAAASGFAVDRPRRDIDSVDLQIRASRKDARIGRAVGLALQLKCTANSPPQDKPLTHELKIKNYDELRLTSQSFLPIILVLVLVPKDETLWLDQTPERMMMMHCAYWKNLRGEKQRQNTASVTVEIDRKQLFTRSVLIDIMGRLAQGGEP